MKRLMAGLLWMAGGSMLGERSDTFEKDVLIEAQAGSTHEAGDSLRRIEVPVLIACGDADPYFPVNYVQEMANVIERATLKLYPGQGHTIITDRQFGQDVFDFVSRQGRVRSDGEHHPS